MSEGDSNGSRNGGGSALVIVVALYPEVTCSMVEVKLLWVRISCSYHFIVGSLWHLTGGFKLKYCISFENS